MNRDRTWQKKTHTLITKATIKHNKEQNNQEQNLQEIWIESFNFKRWFLWCSLFFHKGDPSNGIETWITAKSFWRHSRRILLDDHGEAGTWEATSKWGLIRARLKDAICQNLRSRPETKEVFHLRLPEVLHWRRIICFWPN